MRFEKQEGLSGGVLLISDSCRDGTFQAAISYGSGVSVGSVAVGDFNQDGIPDIVVPNQGQSTAVLLGNGNGSFETQIVYAGGGTGVAVSDFNGDGLPDVVSVNGTLAVLLNAQVAAYNTTGISFTGAVGVHNITASYPGKTGYAASTSSSVALTSSDTTPTIALVSSSSPSAFGAAVSFTATLSSGPTGAITFYDGSTSIGTAQMSGNTATLSLSTLSGGSHSITANWPGNASYSPVTSAIFTQVVTDSTPTVTLSSSGSPANAGSSVTFTATVSSGPSGNITFYDGGSVLGTAAINSGTAILSTSLLAAGTHYITAAWPGNSNYSAVVSSSFPQNISGTTKTPIITWATPSTIAYGTPLSSIQLNATSSVTPGTFSYSIPTGTILKAGAYTLWVTFTPADTNTYNTVEASVPLTVVQATPALVWPTPADISSGTALGPNQLNATSSVVGSLSYSPALGTVLTPGPHILTATFTPADPADFTSATETADITVTEPGNTWDTGTVTITVNNTLAASTTYGKGATPSSIAEGLAAGITTESPVNISAVDNTLSLTSKLPSTTGDYAYSIQTTSHSSSFSQPSFVYKTITGSLDGGAAANTAGGPIYNYSVPASNGYDGIGNLISITDSVMGTWSFNYDNLNRLSAGTQTPTTGAAQSFCWTYDQFGNRTAQTTSNQPFANLPGATTCQLATGSAPLTNNWASYYTNNQISGTNLAPNGNLYDPSGDIIGDSITSTCTTPRGGFVRLLILQFLDQ